MKTPYTPSTTWVGGPPLGPAKPERRKHIGPRAKPGAQWTALERIMTNAHLVGQALVISHEIAQAMRQGGFTCHKNAIQHGMASGALERVLVNAHAPASHRWGYRLTWTGSHTVNTNPPPTEAPMPSPQKPAKRGQRTGIIEPVATSYTPAAPPSVKESLTDAYHANVPEQNQKSQAPALPQWLAAMGVSITTGEPVPDGKPHASMGKYDPLFDGLPYGGAIRASAADVGKIAHAMRKYLQKRKKPGYVRLVSAYPGDTMGRVWLLQADAKGARA